jgi:proliferating cell nuclear antigen
MASTAADTKKETNSSKLTSTTVTNMETVPATAAAEPKALIKITTVQTAAFKTLIEALKDILLDCNIEFIPDGEGEGTDQAGSMKILAVNNQAGMLVHMRLHSTNFDEFSCMHRQAIGINMQTLYKVIKTINNNDILTLHRSANDFEKNRFCVKIMNKDKRQIFQYSLQIIDVDTDVMDVSQASFQAIVTMNSSDFQKVCKDMNGIEAKYVDIMLVGNVFKISGKGESALGSAEFTENQSGSVTINRKDDTKHLIITGKYELKNLLLFTRCTNLCNHIEIYMKNDYPLLIKYMVASLGYMHLCLSPVIDDSY